ncbi:MAG TPA: hypothetical protein VHF25_03020 [Nitriliruptorales bacterium]|nr:hypothetical protein [Nitriliruptorales bacterium]
MHEEHRRITERLMSLPGVVGVDIDAPAGRDRVLVFVDRTVASADLPQEQRIPETIEGYPVEIIESGPLMAENGENDDGRPTGS